MQLTDLLTAERVIFPAHASSKKKLLQVASEALALSPLPITATDIFDSLIARERLGSTGLGGGVAIPHGRIKGAAHAFGAFIRLDQPIEYDAIDGQPVDMLFALVVPEESTEVHLEILSMLAQMFSDQAFCQRLRRCSNAQEQFAQLSAWQADNN